MPTTFAPFVFSFLLLLSGFAVAQERASCAMMKGLDLKPLLGADHDAPVNFGQESCRAESNRPGKIVVLGLMSGTAAEHQKMFAMIKKINSGQRAKEVRSWPSPRSGRTPSRSARTRDAPDRDHGHQGRRARYSRRQGGIGKALSDAEVKQFVGLAKATLDKLP